MSIPVVHVTDVLQFFTCRQRWFWSSRMSMNLEPVRPQRPFVLGTAFHEGVRMLYEKNMDTAVGAVRAVFHDARSQYTAAGGIVDSALVEQLTNDTVLCEGMLATYAAWAVEADEDWEIIDTERPFAFPVWKRKGEYTLLPSVVETLPWIVLEGRIDGLSIHKPTRTVWLREYKSAERPPDDVSKIEKDLQARFYCRMAAQLLGRGVAGIEYRFVRKAVAQLPTFLKRGGLSMALTGAGENVTPFTFRQAFEMYYQEEPTLDNLNAHGYGDHYLALVKREKQKSAFVTQYMLNKTSSSQESALQTVLHAAQEMLECLTPGNEWRIHAQPDWWKCPKCAYRSPCDRVEDGRDPTLVLKHDYRVRADYERTEYIPLEAIESQAGEFKLEVDL